MNLYRVKNYRVFREIFDEVLRAMEKRVPGVSKVEAQETEDDGQVFISTHSPDFLNAVQLEELFCLVKKDGYTKIYKASDNATIRELYNAGDFLGQLWRQNLLIEEVAEFVKKSKVSSS